jgi:hypothetical protein
VTPSDTQAAGPSVYLSSRLTVKEDIGVNTIFQSRGILAEFKLVGRFDAGPRALSAEASES